MNMCIINTIANVAHAIYSACHNDLSILEYPWRKPGESPEKTTKRTRRPEPRDLERVEVFQQTWGSTALGFGGMGGQAVTTANVVIVTGPAADACVYFGHQFAYRIERPNEVFASDITKRHMADVSGAKKRYERVIENPKGAVQ